MTIRPGSSGRRTGGAPRRLFWAVLLSLLVLSSTVSAQPIETSGSQSQIWKSRYLQLAQKVTRLEKAWSKQKLAYDEAVSIWNSLKTEHSLLQDSLTTSGQSLGDSEATVARLTSLSNRLSNRLSGISQEISEVKAAAQAAIRNAQLTGWIVGAGGIILGILIALVF